jgi:hypothetical protein
MRSFKTRLAALERYRSDAGLFVVMRAGSGVEALLRDRGIDPDESTVVVLRTFCEDRDGEIIQDDGRPAGILSISKVH